MERGSGVDGVVCRDGMALTKARSHGCRSAHIRLNRQWSDNESCVSAHARPIQNVAFFEALSQVVPLLICCLGTQIEQPIHERPTRAWV